MSVTCLIFLAFPSVVLGRLDARFKKVAAVLILFFFFSRDVKCNPNIYLCV